MKGLKTSLECTNQVNIDLSCYDGDDDIWNVEMGDIIECMICDEGVKLKVNDFCWYTLKPSVLGEFFKIV